MNATGHRAVAVVIAALLAGCGGSGTHARPAAATTPRGTVAVPRELLLAWTTDFRRHLVPLSQFQAGGPGKDGIPAIVHPRFAAASQTTFLVPRDPVIELDIGGQARAYPLDIMVWHEIVDDTVAGVPVAVTFCPLCDTSIVFDRRVGGRVLEFGTTGELRNSDLVMYDRQTESWWQQFTGQALVGSLAGQQLREVPSSIVSWAAFRSQHPAGLVLSRDTGYSRPYGTNPYPGYDSVNSPPFFPVDHGNDHRLAPKERVVYVQHAGQAAAVPYSTLARLRRVAFTLAGTRLVVSWQPGVASALDGSSIAAGRDVGSAQVRDTSGRMVAFDSPFWFAVAAFRPDVRIIRSSS
jgi:hypothetical protein